MKVRNVWHRGARWIALLVRDPEHGYRDVLTIRIGRPTSLPRSERNGTRPWHYALGGRIAGRW